MTISADAVRPVGLGRRLVQPAREAYRAALAEVQRVVEFVQRPTCDAALLEAWARNDRRALRTLETHSYYLGLDVEPLVEAVLAWLQEADHLDFVAFVSDVMPAVLTDIDAVVPHEIPLQEPAAHVYACHYAVSLRAALVHLLLARVDTQYAAPRFRSLREASAWTQAFGEFLEEVNAVLDGTRELLQQEALAVQHFLDHQRRHLRRLEVRLRAQASHIEPLTWADELQEAERTALETLSAWADALEEQAFSGLETARRSGALELAAKHLARRAPRLALTVLGVAAGATLVSQAVRPNGMEQVASRLAVLPRTWETAATDPREAVSGLQLRVRRFLDELVHTRGRQTVEVKSGRALNALLEELRRFGYQPAEVLRALGLERVEEADGRDEPVKLTLQATGDGVLLVPPEREQERSVPVVPPVVAAYKVQPGDTLWRLSRTFGVPISRILAANPQLQDPDVIVVGQVLRIPGVTWAESQRQTDVRVRWGDPLSVVADAVGVPVEELAELNGIRDPERWMYDGRPLVLPIRVLQPEKSQGARTPRETSSAKEPAAKAETRVKSSAEAPRLSRGTLPEAHNAEPAATAARGQPHDASKAKAPVEKPLLRRGEIGLERAREAGRLVTVPAKVDGQALVKKYGATLWPSIEAMPPEVRAYFTQTVQEVADFFNVRPGDILGILKMENNGAGWRIYQPAVSSAGAKGVAQVIARTWNGWANPVHDRHVTNLAEIERYGGIGFDWSKRQLWKAWQEGRVPLEVLADSNADPMIFENSVAAVARHLVHWGLTRDKAEADPEWFERRLADAVAVYNSGRVLSESANWRQSPHNATTVQDYVEGARRTAETTPERLTAGRPAAWHTLANTYREAYEAAFGVRLSDAEVEKTLEKEALIVKDVLSGKLTPTEGARQLLGRIEAHYLNQGREALKKGKPLPWPYVYNAETLAAQKLAVAYLGHALTAPEVETLVAETKGDVDAMERRLAERGDAIIVARAEAIMEGILERPVRRTEVAAIVQPLVAGKDPYRMDAGFIDAVLEEVKAKARAMREAERPAGERGYFRALPLNPMPRVYRGFGVPVNYQAGGRHTGIDVGLPQGPDGQDPELYAVDDGTVVHVGPLYCNAPRKCRGDKAIIIDHGNNVYSIYSHNSEAYVKVGQRVRAGQVIGRQGNEGYSFGSHLHFEVHVGAPFTGDWRQPFRGGTFVDPLDWLPEW